MKVTPYIILLVVGAMVSGILLISGCSKSTNIDTTAPDLLVKNVSEIEDRINRHYYVMLSDTASEGHREEMLHYLDDLEHLMDDLGDILGERENCHMALGGHMMGSADIDSTCPSFENMNDLHEEYHRHFREMEYILHDDNHGGFDDEMETHLDHMHHYMDAMMYYLDEMHDTGMMHDHHDDEHDDGDHDDDDHHGGGHGHGHSGG